MAKKESAPKNTHPEAKGLLFILLSVISLVCLFSYDIDDKTTNWMGMIGHGYAWTLMYLFGLTVYIVLGFVGWIGWKLLLQGEIPRLKSKIFYLSLLGISFSFLLNLAAEKGLPIPGAMRHKILTESITMELPYIRHTVRHNLGGVPVYFLYRDLPSFNLQHMLSDVGVGITFTLTGLLSFLFLTEVRIMDVVQGINARRSKKEEEREMQILQHEHIEKTLTKKIATASMPAPLYNPEKKPEIRIRTTGEKEEKQAAPKPVKGNFSGYDLPPPSLLTNPKKFDQPQLKKELKRQAEILEES